MIETPTGVREFVGTAFRLDRLFEERAACMPTAIALVDGVGTVTYAELDAAANRVAEAIGREGLHAGASVGVYIDRSRAYVAAVLGILKMNGAVVPLPPSYPVERLRGVLSFARLDAVIDDGDACLEPGLHPRILHVSFAGDGAPSAPPARPGGPDDAAFILCSSGSTGEPKMIVRSHRSFFHRLQWTWSKHPYAPGEVCCQKAYMTTTHAVYELFEPLLRGVPVCIISDTEVRALETFWDTLRRKTVSRLLIVPSMLQASLDMPDFAPPPGIKVLVLMGEPVHSDLALQAIAAFPSAAGIYSIYGSTEASSVLVCDLRASARQGHELPLGEPISSDIRVRVLGENLESVPAGSPGMLHVSGPALFSGYFRNPTLTAQALVVLDGEQSYCTHDRVCRAAEGEISYLGRADSVVKVRGFRVDLEEVERVIALHPEVRRCAVAAERSTNGDSTLLAFVSPDDVRHEEVYRVLRERLPDYMLPSRVIGLPGFPLTSSGKIDRMALLKNHAPGNGLESTAEFPSDSERRLAGVWRAVLGHGAFDRHSNFFEVGGSSLKTFSVIARLRDGMALGREQLPDDSIYRFPTIERLAAHLGGIRDGHAPDAVAGGSVLVTLRAARGVQAPPLFVVASAGGSLGAYEKVIRALGTTREVIGVRDPCLWGGRDPVAGFQDWIALYLRAIRERQPRGPYHLLAYSSAGAFGYELARLLRSAGEEVALLALVDPVAMDRCSKWRFGHWALEARFMRTGFTPLVKAAGRLRRLVPRRWRRNPRATSADQPAFTSAGFARFANEARTNRQHILQLSALMELNTGLPLALASKQLDERAPGQYLDALLANMHAAAPDVDAETIRRLAVQYPLQVRAQHRYRLQPLDCTVVLFEVSGRHCGLLATQLGPYVPRLVACGLPMAEPVGRVRDLAGCFPPSMRPHYLCMRDDLFARALARRLDELLGVQDAAPGESAARRESETGASLQSRGQSRGQGGPLRTGAETVTHVLRQLGADCVFGLPGTQNVALFEALRGSGLRLVVATSELSASMMANGYFRASGRTGVLMTIPGPGFTWALSGLAEAALDSAAIVHFTSTPASSPGRRFRLQALDQSAMVAPIARHVFTVEHATGDVAARVTEAWHACRAGEPGPVLVQIARKVWESPVEAGIATAAAQPVTAETDVSAITAELANARRCVLLLGQGCNDASVEVTRLAESLGALVVTTTSGRGVVAEDHPLSLGFALAGNHAGTLNALIEASDRVLAIGCKFSHNGSRGFRLRIPEDKLVHVDASREVLNANYPARLAVLSDSRRCILALLDALGDGGARGFDAEEIADWRARCLEEKVRGRLEPRVGGGTPAVFFAALRAAMPRESCLVTDAGRHQDLARRHFPVLCPRGLVTPTNLQSMGFGISAAMGAVLADPRRPVVALIGDGGLAMSGLELLTAVRERMAMTVIVFVDGAYAAIRDEQIGNYGRASGTEFSSPDCEALARAVGAGYIRLKTDPEATLRSAVTAKDVTLVEVEVGDSIPMRVDHVKNLARATARRKLQPWRRSRHHPR